jgi:dTDP-4-amino-4,6-dideoxygalactose transaminase
MILLSVFRRRWVRNSWRSSIRLRDTSRFAADGLFLPTDTGLNELEQDYIIGQVRDFHHVH